MAPISTKSAQPQRTALIIGPDRVLENELATALEGWNIERANDNGAALSRINASPFDLVITSENTSCETDLDLLRKIRRVRPHIRLIILTNESTPADVIASMRERAFSYFSTPVSPATLTEIVRLVRDEPCWDDGIEIISATPAWIRLLARCNKNTADRLMQFFHEIIDLPEPEEHEVASAFREMLLNAIEHGGRFDPTQYVEISYVRAQHMVICRVKDPGEGFSLEEIQHAAVANPPEDPLRHQAYRDSMGLRPGGFGVLLTRHLVDELIYAEKGNEVLLIKYLNSGEVVRSILSQAS